MTGYNFDIKIRMFETDLFGRTHFSSFFRYIDMASADFFESIGIDPRIELNHLPVVEAKCRYYTPTYFGEHLDTRAAISELKEKALKITFKFHRKSDGVLVAEGYQILVAIDQEGKSTPIPEKLRKILINNLDS